MTRKVATIITAVTGDRVVVGEAELQHAIEEHFSMLPADMLLELIERILKDPTKIFKQEKLRASASNVALGLSASPPMLLEAFEFENSGFSTFTTEHKTDSPL